MSQMNVKLNKNAYDRSQNGKDEHTHTVAHTYTVERRGRLRWLDIWSVKVGMIGCQSEEMWRWWEEICGQRLENFVKSV